MRGLDVNPRPEQVSDHAAIRVVNREAFAGDAEADLVDMLRREPDFIAPLSLVAELSADGRGDALIIGHIMLSPIMIRGDNGDAPALALAPMAVRPAWQRRGVGSALVRAALERARALGHGGVVVLGHEHYYPRFGFEPASRWGIRAPWPVPDAAFMAMELQPDSLGHAAGVVRYARPFESL